MLQRRLSLTDWVRGQSFQLLTVIQSLYLHSVKLLFLDKPVEKTEQKLELLSDAFKIRK